VPLVFVVSLLPDVDLLLGNVSHRGPTHSLLTASVFFSIPFFLLGVIPVLPYFSAVVSHLVIDSMVGWSKLLWPLTLHDFHFALGINMGTLNEAYFETLLLALFFFVLTLSGDHAVTYRSPYRYLMLVAVPALVVPLVTGYPLTVPSFLLLPHLILLIYVFYSVFHLRVKWHSNL
jgi:hypothetical protein